MTSSVEILIQLFLHTQSAEDADDGEQNAYGNTSRSWSLECESLRCCFEMWWVGRHNPRGAGIHRYTGINLGTKEDTSTGQYPALVRAGSSTRNY